MLKLCGLSPDPQTLTSKIDEEDLTRKIMSLLQANVATTEAQLLRKENAALKEQLARVSESSISISENLEAESVLQEVINNV